MRKSKLAVILLAAIAVVSLIPVPARCLTTPESYLGFPVGADRKLARYDQVVEYLNILAKESARVMLDTLGASTMGKPLVLAVISSESNMAGLDRYREIAETIATRKITDSEAESLSREGKTFVLILCNQHSNEIASSNTSVQLAYDLAAGVDPALESALENVIVLIAPSANPDGQQMIVDYYRRYVGTRWEGGALPWLYHKYADHDDNRDWFFLNLDENYNWVDALYGDWFPQAMVDVHQMGSLGARMFVPPFVDPPNPNNPLLIWDKIELLGVNMKYRLAEQGKSGVINNAYYSGWYQGSIRPNATQHNIVALLTENASAKIATPVYIDPSELEGHTKGLPEYGVRMNFTNPWPGGWWRLKDIVDYQLISQKAMIDAMSRYKKDFLLGQHAMKMDACELSSHGAPYAYLVPPAQSDPTAVYRMLKIFERTRCGMSRAVEPFEADGRSWPAGTVVLKLDQPYGRFIKDLMEVKEYPEIREYPGGPPLSPYDNAGWTLPLLMGVESYAVNNPFEANLETLESAPLPVSSSSGTRVIASPADLGSFRAVNSILAQGKGRVWRVNQSIEGVGENFSGPGAFLIEGDEGYLNQIASESKTAFQPVDGLDLGETIPLKKTRIGVYRGWVKSIDEGWTRLVFDEFGFNYGRLDNERICKGELIKDYDVIVLPQMNPEQIIDGANSESDKSSLQSIPPEYQGGITSAGVEELETFVAAGGVLIAMREAALLPIEHFGIPVREGLKGLPNTEFFCPGSLVRIKVDNENPLGYGMAETGYAFYSSGLPLATMIPVVEDRDRRVVARYADDNILASGWLIGENYMSGKPAIVDVKYGKGHIVLFGFGVQNRAQTWGTFKFLFNAVYLSD